MRYVIGIPGQPPRIIIECEEWIAQMQVEQGEVCFASTDIPPVPHAISNDGTRLTAVDPALDDLRAAMLATLRDDAERVMAITVTAKGEVQSDPTSIARMTLAAQAGQDVDWTMADNSVVTHTPSEMMEMVAAVARHIDETHRMTQTIKAAIRSAETVEELADIETMSAAK